MASFVARRLGYTLIVMWAASVVVFLTLRITPGDPSNFAENPLQTAERKAAVRHALGLDQPILEQYWDFISKLLTFDFGDSFITRQPINDIVSQAAPNTLKLALAALAIVLLVGIPLGVIAALRRDAWLDRGVSIAAPLAMGIPPFVLAILLINVVALDLGWLPVSGPGGLEYLILPAVVLAVEPTAVTVRLMRSSVLDQLSQDYVRTLRAKGLPEWRIVWVHVLRNAVGPIVSLSAVQMRTLLGYTLIVEVIFRWPGLGRELVQSVLARDFPVAQALSLLLTLAVVLLTFLSDVGLAIADPKLRRQATG